jgi:hypothetical protein
MAGLDKAICGTIFIIRSILLKGEFKGFETNLSAWIFVDLLRFGNIRITLIE